MKAVIIFMLLFATVFSQPVKRSASSSESSEEVVSIQPSVICVKPVPILRKATAQLVQATPAQKMTMAASEESKESSDETEESDTESNTASDDSDDSADSADTQGTETDESSESAESGEVEATSAPPIVVDPTEAYIFDNGRGDSIGYPSDYKKTIIYVDSNKIGMEPSPYKTEGVNLISKKMSVYNSHDDNEVEKHLKVYKALQVHDELLDGDTSTPEMETQSLDAASGTEEEPSYRHAGPDSEEIEGQAQEEGESKSEGASASASDTTSESASASASASQEEEEQESDSSQSSEEVTATPGAADSDSSQSSESQESDSEEQTQETTSEPSIVITAK
ncbi:osteopontin [Chanos chanos]|uniref:Osteopontin n=1 Tax=Chanos chanos TaxID=29144 RepID=A0A6J2UVJ4_CHACN|nr:suppressor protein SRP40-like [Chanos chanos]